MGVIEIIRNKRKEKEGNVVDLSQNSMMKEGSTRILTSVKQME